MNILALDLGKFNTMCCFFDTATREYHFLSAVTDPVTSLRSSKAKRSISSSWKLVVPPAGSTISPSHSVLKPSSAPPTKKPGDGPMSNARPTKTTLSESFGRMPTALKESLVKIKAKTTPTCVAPTEASSLSRSLTPPGIKLGASHSHHGQSTDQRWLNRAWITEETQSA
jgi:hypothetical protein